MSKYTEKERLKRRLEKRRRREKRLIALYMGVFASVVVLVAVAVIIGSGIFSSGEADANPGVTEETEERTGETYVYLKQPKWQEQFLTPNEYSRPQKEIEEVNGVVVHYTGNPNTTAKQNRDYFEDLATTHETSASSHFVVGLEGEIIQCIPLNEVAYASRHRNADTISIEVCHPTEEGWFNDKTYDALVELVAWLVVEYDLEIDEVIRHYDVTGKECPKYFVDNESAWNDFKEDIQAYIDTNSELRTK